MPFYFCKCLCSYFAFKSTHFAQVLENYVQTCFCMSATFTSSVPTIYLYICHSLLTLNTSCEKYSWLESIKTVLVKQFSCSCLMQWGVVLALVVSPLPNLRCQQCQAANCSVGQCRNVHCTALLVSGHLVLGPQLWRGNGGVFKVHNKHCPTSIKVFVSPKTHIIIFSLL